MNANDVDDLIVELVTFLGSDGKLSVDGQAELRQRLLPALRLRHPDLTEAQIAATATEIVEKATDIRGNSIQSLERVLDRLVKDLEDPLKTLLVLARTEGARPHVYRWGMLSGFVESAQGLLQDAQSALSHIKGCATCGHDATPVAKPPTN